MRGQCRGDRLLAMQKALHDQTEILLWMLGLPQLLPTDGQGRDGEIASTATSRSSKHDEP